MFPHSHLKQGKEERNMTQERRHTVAINNYHSVISRKIEFYINYTSKLYSDAAYTTRKNETFKLFKFLLFYSFPLKWNPCFCQKVNHSLQSEYTFCLQVLVCSFGVTLHIFVSLMSYSHCQKQTEIICTFKSCRKTEAKSLNWGKGTKEIEISLQLFSLKMP